MKDELYTELSFEQKMIIVEDVYNSMGSVHRSAFINVLCDVWLENIPGFEITDEDSYNRFIEEIWNLYSGYLQGKDRS